MEKKIQLELVTNGKLATDTTRELEVLLTQLQQADLQTELEKIIWSVTNPSKGSLAPKVMNRKIFTAKTLSLYVNTK